jgi:hypothetical protein
MLIETTINIHIDILNRLSRAGQVSGYSKRDIISMLMRRYSFDNTRPPILWSRVKYQKRDVKGNWQRLHLVLNPDEYEYFLDLRKVLKLSVSGCIAYAVDKFLDEILNKIKKFSDNYRYKNYTFSGIIVDGIICWILYWGIPKHLITTP